MPTIAENKAMWDHAYNWGDAGDEWSKNWGSPRAQWYHTLYPRIYPWLPTGTMLEIGPGFGRWTQFFIEECQRLILVDLSQTCIDACQERFAGHAHISYHVNDGRSLDFVPSQSVDFIFSFDSLVHAEADAIVGYLGEIRRVLQPHGVAFVHHSTLGAYAGYLRRIQSLPHRLVRQMARYGLVETLEQQWRAKSISARQFAQMAGDSGLQCISQEVINWQSRRLIDCISVVTPHGSRWARPSTVLRNPYFMREAGYAARMSGLYEYEPSARKNEAPAARLR